jgi:sugar-phosphatase
MLQAVIFDMDGLLIDSEPHWRAAEIEIFGKLGLVLTEEQCMQTMWPQRSLQEVEDDIVQAVEDLVNNHGTAMAGVTETIALFQRLGFRIALASSSSMRLITCVLRKLGIREAFEVVHSAEFEEYGKPHPAIFLSTARQLGISPTQCLVFEDSFNGLIAAKAARMKAVAVPEGEHYAQTRYDFADLKLRSLLEFQEKNLAALSRLG